MPGEPTIARCPADNIDPQGDVVRTLGKTGSNMGFLGADVTGPGARPPKKVAFWKGKYPYFREISVGEILFHLARLIA